LPAATASCRRVASLRNGNLPARRAPHEPAQRFGTDKDEERAEITSLSVPNLRVVLPSGSGVRSAFWVSRKSSMSPPKDSGKTKMQTSLCPAQIFGGPSRRAAKGCVRRRFGSWAQCVPLRGIGAQGYRGTPRRRAFPQAADTPDKFVSHMQHELVHAGTPGIALRWSLGHGSNARFRNRGVSLLLNLPKDWGPTKMKKGRRKPLCLSQIFGLERGTPVPRDGARSRDAGASRSCGCGS
jgi:hypothetical protein